MALASSAPFGDLLRRYREAAALTQEELAARAGLSEHAISQLERGARQRPQRGTVALLAEALGLAGPERASFEDAARGRGGPPHGAGPGTDGPADRPPSLTNLPLQLTSFVGREQALAEVRRLLGTTRLLTLTGVGGAGKTRLALQVAGEVLAAYPEGVWLVELAPLADAAQVPRAVAAVLGVHEEAGRPLAATLADVLRPQQVLLLLDNCEHLLAACALLADALLRACPHLHILATSREALGIGGETTWRVPSLAVPAAVAPGTRPPALAVTAPCEAVQLFIARAASVAPDFALTAQNAAAVGEICRRLDGIPLAIELAAARVRGMAVEQLMARLDQPFRLLTGGSRVALPRQQTLQTTVDWSYGLLRLPEQTLFARLSVFAGGFTLEAVEAVGAGAVVGADEVLDLLLGLVDKSLVVAEEGSTRYRLQETLRQYGREKAAGSGDAAAVHARHATYYLGIAEEAERQLRGPAQIAWFDRLETEHDNLLAAARWFAQSEQAEHALRLAGALTVFWEVRGRRNQGRALLADVLALPRAAAHTAERAHALWAAGLLTLFGAHSAAARAPLEESLAIARELDDSRAIGYALWGLALQVGWPSATVAVTEGRLEEMRDLLEKSLEVLRAAGDRWAGAWVLYLLGDVACAEGDALAARALCDESRRTFLELGDRVGLRACQKIMRPFRARAD